MKKKRLLFFLVPIIIVLLAVCPYKNRTFFQSKLMFTKTFHHDRNELNNAIFEGYSIKLGGYQISIEKSVYEKEKYSFLIDRIQKDLCEIHSLSKDVVGGVIYIIPEGWNIKSDENNCIYATVSSVKDGTYLESFAGRFLGCKGEWKKLSFVNLVRGKKCNKKDIKRILNRKDYMDALKLNPLYLDKRSNPNYKLAKQVAVDFGRWVTDKYGFATFLKSKGEQIPEYYHDYVGKESKIKINTNYKYGTECYIDKKDELSVTDGDVFIDFSKQFNINLNNNYKALCEFMTMKDRLKSLIIEKKLTSKKEKNFLKNIRVHCIGDGEVNTSKDQKIVIVDECFSFFYLMHELSHSYLEQEFKRENSWLIEGTAVYLEALLEQEAYEKGIIKESSCKKFNSRIKCTSEECRFLDLVVKKYEEKSGISFQEETYNFPLYYKCAAAMYLTGTLDKNTHLAKTNVYMSVNDSYGYKEQTNCLNEMSYFQSALLVDYLVKHGMQRQIVEYGESEKTFKECFHCTEEELYAAFKKWVIKEY